MSLNLKPGGIKATCQSCASVELVSVSGKTRDTQAISAVNHAFEYDGYGLATPWGAGCSDYMDFVVCMNCGQMQGNWGLTVQFIADLEGAKKRHIFAPNADLYAFVSEQFKRLYADPAEYPSATENEPAFCEPFRLGLKELFDRDGKPLTSGDPYRHFNSVHRIAKKDCTTSDFQFIIRACDLVLQGDWKPST